MEEYPGKRQSQRKKDVNVNVGGQFGVITIRRLTGCGPFNRNLFRGFISQVGKLDVLDFRGNGDKIAMITINQQGILFALKALDFSA